MARAARRIASYPALEFKGGTPIAIGDEQSGRWAYQNLLELGAADIWRVDVTCVGGISEFRKIAALASVFGIPATVLPAGRRGHERTP